MIERDWCVLLQVREIGFDRLLIGLGSFPVERRHILAILFKQHTASLLSFYHSTCKRASERGKFSTVTFTALCTAAMLDESRPAA